MKTCKNRKGFTLIEMMIAAASAAILALLVSLILFLAYLSWRTNNAGVQLQRDSEHAINMMSRDIRESSSIDIIAIENYLILPTNAVRSDVTAYVKTSNTLSRYVNDIESGLLIPNGLMRFYPHVQSNGVLLHLKLANTREALTVTNITFIETRN
jgi:prepilin-type N-terminal cleavage/methylation domain-containing protein